MNDSYSENEFQDDEVCTVIPIILHSIYTSL
jgi:hypothetical protein